MTNKNDTRERILRHAADLFWRQGFTSTGIAQILREADANSGSLYYFFPTKEDLLLAVLEQYKQWLWPMVVGPVFERINDPIERIFGIMDGYRRGLLSTGCSKGCPIGNLALEISAGYPQGRKLVAENFVNWRKVIEDCLEAAADRLPPDVDKPQLAAFILSVMEGGMMQAVAHRDIAPFEAAVAQLRDYFERLLSDSSNWSAPRPDSTHEDN